MQGRFRPPDSDDVRPVDRIRVVVADDDQRFREVLRALLEADGRFDIVGEATNGAAVVALASDVQPEVIVMDIVMPLINGIEATRRIRADHPDCQVVLVSGKTFQEHPQAGTDAALEAGASAYVLKSADLLNLTETMFSVARGRAAAVN